MTIARHETCLEYFRRRLSEGWKCISLEGHNAVLLSPEGIRRELDLRNDVETLRPNAAGDETDILQQYPVGGAHWEKVDEVSPDENSTYVYSAYGDGWRRDLYKLPASSGLGTINKITVYFRGRGTSRDSRAKASIKSNSTVTDMPEYQSLPEPWGTFLYEWTENPAGGAWEWADIDALQIGVYLYAAFDEARCTQVYVEVDYTPLPWSGKVSGVTNPAKVMGVDVANIAKVKGV